MRRRRLVSILLVIPLLITTVPAAATSQPAAEDRAELERYWQQEMGQAAPTDGIGGGAHPSPPDTLAEPLSPDAQQPDRLTANPVFDRELLAKADPDECFVGVGVPTADTPPCEEGQPKVNDAYVWGLAKAGRRLWFGTGANVLCLVLGGFLGRTEPTVNGSWVCEYGESAIARQAGLPSALGDWRPPHIYRYDLRRRELVDAVADAGAAFGAEDRVRLRSTLGIRAAGSLGGVVLLGGPSLALDAVNLFAFTRAGRYLGSTTLSEYDNIRKFIRRRKVLYLGVSNTAGGGSVLRWTGDADNPFGFEVVGQVDGQASELAMHRGRLYAATWPTFDPSSSTPTDERKLAALWQSPKLGRDGLDAGDAGAWRKVWDVAEYEVDPVTALTYGGGALHSYGGHLYWGTMHVPFLATAVHADVYGRPEGRDEAIAAALGTFRAISIFRARGFGDEHQTELLYGASTLPVFRPDSGWQLEPNRAGPPAYGASGFGNPFNSYTWTMGVTDGRLFVGTLDHSYVLAEQLPDLLRENGIPVPPDATIEAPAAGADLWRFDDPDQRARAEDLRGVGNPTSYGVRTMIDTKTALYLGMANPMNLLTDPSGPQGGWELLKLTAPE